MFNKNKINKKYILDVLKISKKIIKENEASFILFKEYLKLNLEKLNNYLAKTQGIKETH